MTLQLSGSGTIVGLADSGVNGAQSVVYTPSGVGAVARTVREKLLESVSVLDFYANGVSGAKVDPTGVLRSDQGIQAALDAAANVHIPAGTYKTTAQLVIAGSNLIGDGVFYSSPYGTSSISGTVIKPVGLQNQAAISITGISNNKVIVGNFGIDMTSNGAPSDSWFNVSKQS